MNFYAKSVRKELKKSIKEPFSVDKKDQYISLMEKAVEVIDSLDDEVLGEYSRGRADGMERMAEILTGGE